MIRGCSLRGRSLVAVSAYDCFAWDALKRGRLARDGANSGVRNPGEKELWAINFDRQRIYVFLYTEYLSFVAHFKYLKNL